MGLHWYNKAVTIHYQGAVHYSELDAAVMI